MFQRTALHRGGTCAVSSARLTNGVVFVSVSGEVDLATAPMLERTLTAALAEGAVGLSIDLSECTFIDSAGIRTLLGAQTELSQTGGRLVLIAPTRTVVRALEVSGFDQTLPMHESRIGALRLAIDA